MGALPWLLIVDDDQALVDLLRHMFRRQPAASGVEIETANTPAEALRVVASRCAEPLVVLSDYDLKAELDGIELLARIREICPSTRRILYSGHPRHHIEPRLTPAVDAFYEKPDRLTDLLEPILQQIDASAHESRASS